MTAPFSNSAAGVIISPASYEASGTCLSFQDGIQKRFAPSFSRIVLSVPPNIMEASIVCLTSRLILREFNESDVDSLFGFRGDPEVMRFSITGPETREDIRTKYLPSCLRRYSRDGLGQWAVVRKSDGICVGECGICAQEVDGEKEFEISYRIRRDCWGDGLATEAALACCDYGFKQAGLHHLISIIESENTASIRVAEKIGMTLKKTASFHNIPVLIYSVANTLAGSSCQPSPGACRNKRA